ncbi:differentially expressed in FDCP 8 homolog isoform X2 [Tubulanus polymorphus]
MHSKDVDENDVSFADLGLTEDHFSQPEGVFGLSTTEELEMAIENCKELIKEAGDNQQKKNNLVHKLVQLRLRLQEAKEGPEEAPEDWKLVLGHRFRHQDSKSSQRHCERCNTVIWGMLQLWYRCEICGYSCHSKCLNVITRMCAITKVNECPTYCLSICPEKGLDAQQFRCAECRTVISFKESFSEPRQCDYTGDYYCENCHWNDVAIIPARVIHNWDFDQRRVCRASKQFLHLMSKKAVLRIQDMNPMLFSFGDELQEIKRLREQILIMKKYILNCQEALASKLLLQLQDRQHFVDNSDMYSLRDLLDLQGDLLLPSVTKIHASFAQHIKTDCQLCQAKGYICELCDSDEVLFPFDAIATVCPSCSAVLHKHCYIRRGSKCPRCERLARRESMQR